MSDVEVETVSNKEEGQIHQEVQPKQLVNIRKEDIRFYKCCGCHASLFTNHHIIEHEVGHGQKDFRHRKRDRNAFDIVHCTSFFVDWDKLPWLKDQVNDKGHYGRLECPKCDVKIGNFNWSGSTCSCGTFVYPGVQVQKTKVMLL
ncbi:hypothetical protein PCE1_002295 [Barthelona sp. PCE]